MDLQVAVLAAILGCFHIQRVPVVNAFSNQKFRQDFITNTNIIRLSDTNFESNNSEEKLIDTDPSRVKSTDDEKRRFSMNELASAKAINRELMDASTAQEVLSIFSGKGGAKGFAGAGIFNSVNYSTILHRLARFSTQIDHTQRRRKNLNNSNSRDEKRKHILSDPRTAILMSSLAEALIDQDMKSLEFSNRELANIGWALSKLKLSPPSRIFPVVRPSGMFVDSGTDYTSHLCPGVVVTPLEDMQENLAATARKVRTQVLEVAKERSKMTSASERAAVINKWIPTLSQMSAQILDMIAAQVLGILNEFNSQELANLLYAFASASRADQTFFEQLAQQLNREMRNKSFERGKYCPKPQEFSNSIWAFASVGLRGDGQVKLLETVAEFLDSNNGQVLHKFKPQELSNTVWATSTLLSKRGPISSQLDDIENTSAIRINRRVAEALESRIVEFKPQEISNSIWAFATVGFGAASTTTQINTNNEYFILPSNQIFEDRELVARSLVVVARNALSRLGRFRPQELNNLAWGFCRLGHSDKTIDELFIGIGKQLMKRHKFFKPQDIGTTLWSFATVEYYDEDVYKSAASELTLLKSHSFKPQELSNTVWALATAGMQPKFANVFDTTVLPRSKRARFSMVTKDPVSECFAAATTELMRRPHHFKAQEIKDILWSLSKVGIRHPAVFKSVAKHLVGSDDDVLLGHVGRGLQDFSPQGLGNLSWSYAKQAQLAAEVDESTIGSTGRLAVFETVCLDVGEKLIQRLFAGICEQAFQGPNALSRFKPQDLSNTCWAFATLGLLHRKFFDAVSDQVHLRILEGQRDDNNPACHFKAQEIANLVWSFATLNHKSNGLLHSFTPYLLKMCSDGKKIYDTRSIAKFIKRQEVANIAWSCAVFEEYPEHLMPLLYAALFGTEKGSAEEVRRFYDDCGIQKQTIMTMFYVQTALHLECPELGLRLPDSFPLGWISDDTSPALEANASILRLTTSRLQQTISRDLKAMGFDHVLEHTISTDDLKSDYEIYLSSDNHDFLSIDIANLECKVGIEVDGPGHFVQILDGENNDFNNILSKGEAMKGKRGLTGWKFTATSQQQTNGPTALKHRLMNRLGWSIGHIPYYEWRRQNDIEIYCRRLLSEL